MPPKAQDVHLCYKQRIAMISSLLGGRNHSGVICMITAWNYSGMRRDELLVGGLFHTSAAASRQDVGDFVRCHSNNGERWAETEEGARMSPSSLPDKAVSPATMPTGFCGLPSVESPASFKAYW